MKKVNTPWETLPKFLIVGFGVPFCVIGVFFLSSDGGQAFFINGIVWLTLGTAVKLKCCYDQHKLNHLKQSGDCYDGTAVSILPNSFVRIGNYVTSRVMCSYIGETGRICVKSNLFLLTPFDRKENLQAKVYVDHADSRKYMIELYRLDG